MQKATYASPYGGDAAPVVVQGTVVDAPYDNNKAPSTNYVQQIDNGGYNSASISQGGVTKGEKQPKRCNDVFFAVLFYAHLAVMVWVAATYAPQMTSSVANGYDANGGGRRLLLSEDSFGAVHRALSGAFGRHLDDENDNNANEDNGNEDNNGNDNNNNANANNNGGEEVDYADVYSIMLITGLCGFGISILSLSALMAFAETLIKMALFFNMGVSLLMGIAGVLTGAIPLAIMGFVFFALSACYAKSVWERIPFAAQNLITATSAVKKNFGLNIMAYTNLLLMLGWTLWWSTAFVSTLYVTNGCDASGVCERQANGGIVFAFLVSYYWVHQVLKNVVHVTVAGTVGTWWFAPAEAASCCSNAVRDSFMRAVTYSFGSICFGSLIVAVIEAAKAMVRMMREQDDGILICIADCLLGCLEAIAEYFNKWAFVYVGLYGYSFVESGKNVIALFKSRGWDTVITDNLIGNVLTMVGAGVGLITGLIGILLAGARGLGAEYVGGAFMVGFLVGFVLTSVLMGVVESAVNTVIVCYAEAPNEFQQNHPELSLAMREKWRQAWPTEFKY